MPSNPNTGSPRWLTARSPAQAPATPAATSPHRASTPGTASPATSPAPGETTATSPNPKAGNPRRPKIPKARPSRSDDLLEGVATDVEALADRLVASSLRPEVAALVRPDLPDALRAMIAGAKVVGPAGQGERANLLKLAGLPVQAAAGKEGDASTQDRLARLGSRIEEALARSAQAQRRVLGAEDGTPRVVLDAKPKGNLTFDA